MWSLHLQSLKICRQTMCSLQTHAEGNSHQWFTGNVQSQGCQPPLWSAGQLWATPQAGQQKCPLLCLQQCWRISELFKYIISPVEKSPQLSTREYPLGKPWWLRSLSFLVCTGDRMQPGKKRKWSDTVFQELRRKKTWEIFSHLCFTVCLLA